MADVPSRLHENENENENENDELDARDKSSDMAKGCAPFKDNENDEIGEGTKTANNGPHENTSDE